MLGSAISNLMMFFVIVGVAVIFVAVWIMKSEARIKVARNQIKALRSRLESGERERYMLAEKLSSEKEPAPPPAEAPEKEAPQHKGKGASRKDLDEALKAKSALEEENRKLKSELAEATASLTEVYKALCEK
jgi:hypothetical protein